MHENHIMGGKKWRLAAPSKQNAEHNAVVPIGTKLVFNEEKGPCLHFRATLQVNHGTVGQDWVTE